MPRFAFEKFPLANDRLTTQMKSVGEVMAMGRTFQESFQKGPARPGSRRGRDFNLKTIRPETIDEQLAPAPERIWYVAGLPRRHDVRRCIALTKIDPWFLVQIEDIVETEN